MELRLIRLTVAAGTASAAGLLATPVLAHVAADAHGSFLTGFLHPLGGVDHLVVMIAVGLWAIFSGGQRVWVWPTAFVSAMVMGGIIGRAGIELPMVEPAIAASAILLGIAIGAALKVSVGLGAAMVAIAAIFHGHAHGTEAPAGDWLGYAFGFVLATALLHAAGIGFGSFLQSRAGLISARLLGAATAALGVVLLVQ